MGGTLSRGAMLALVVLLELSGPALARKPWASDAARERGFIDIRTAMDLVTSDDANGFSQSVSATYGALSHLSTWAGGDYLLDDGGALAGGGFWAGIGSPWWTSGKKAWAPYLLLEPRITLGMTFHDLDNPGASLAGTFLEQPSSSTAESALEVRPALYSSLQIFARSFVFASIGGTLVVPLNSPAEGGQTASLSSLCYSAGVNVNLTGRSETPGLGFVVGFRRTKNFADHTLDRFALFATLGFHLEVPDLTVSVGGTMNTLPTPGSENVTVVNLALTWSYDTLCDQHDPECDPD